MSPAPCALAKELPRPVGGPGDFSPVGAATPAEAVQQGYLDALPIAAAIIAQRAGGIDVVAANPTFHSLRKAVSDAASGGCPLVDGSVGPALAAFLHGGEASHDFDWVAGDAIDSRHFFVRVARLPACGGAVRALVSLVDRTAEVRTQRSLQSEMLHDSLTGLPNRAAFNEAMEQVIAGDGDVAVLAIDLRRFSRINECMGAIVGDELIVTVARRLIGAIRAGDLIARMGGDEFTILLRLHDGPGDALRAAERIRGALSTPFRLTDLEVRVDCAIGCALMSNRISVTEDLVRNAQFALKRAKQSGRLEIYQPGEVNIVRRRFSVETELRRAIEAEQLSLAFQPLIDLQSGRLTGFEALARWQHEHRGAISPAEFIPVAEESGLIVPLGRWAAGAAATALATWDRAAGRELPLSVSVNVSAIQIARDDVGGVIEQALSASGIDGSRLTIELTESAIINDPQRAGRVLAAIKDLRARIAMDDFGTGYSNLAYLQKLPIDILKIDRTFVAPMLRDRDSLAIVRAVLSLADALGMSTTAEGVESPELAQTLAALGCATGQGYHFAKPLGQDAAFAYWMAREASATASSASA
ncbi:putative bifunctional diguanylate cyclase/phosphodiesterase [Sphingomonas jatrophae]|uniref:Diguanylate cyclase/phosphodiesterase n=1 Tax=Sphingomonas jatrophae TaxID=1166337 RepID=A0A1I6M611_9SPHN|nr:EAL domain-containing protein [Sphingomonas jatrophae]SFS11150.1 diguanylate cyclase/phosphodiesterase [Sphingomonas jatrophae]